MLYSWCVVSVLTLVIGSVMAEICSEYPVAGSVYQWTGLLGTERSALSYCCGWFNFVGNIATACSFAYGISYIVFGFQSL